MIEADERIQELEALEALAGEISRVANETGHAIREGGIDAGYPIAGSSVGSVIETGGALLAGIVNAPNEASETLEAAGERYEEGGGGLNGTALGIGEALGTNTAAEGIAGSTLEGQTIDDPWERGSRITGGLGGATLTLAGPAAAGARALDGDVPTGPARGGRRRPGGPTGRHRRRRRGPNDPWVRRLRRRPPSIRTTWTRSRPVPGRPPGVLPVNGWSTASRPCRKILNYRWRAGGMAMRGSTKKATGDRQFSSGARPSRDQE